MEGDGVMCFKGNVRLVGLVTAKASGSEQGIGVRRKSIPARNSGARIRDFGPREAKLIRTRGGSRNLGSGSTARTRKPELSGFASARNRGKVIIVGGFGVHKSLRRLADAASGVEEAGRPVDSISPRHRIE